MPLSRVEEIVAAANALDPDLVVLLGDYAAGHRFITRPVSMRDFAAASAALRAPLGVHAVLGNHDWWDDREAQAARRGPVLAQRELERVGIPVLENDAVRLEKNGRHFWLLGLGDQLALLGRPHRGVDDLDGTVAKVTGDAPAILLAHEPDIFPKVPDRVDAHPVGTHPRRTGPAVRLFARGSLGLRQPLCLRPCGRGRPAPDRLRRPRDEHHARPIRASAGNRADRAGPRPGRYLTITFAPGPTRL